MNLLSKTLTPAKELSAFYTPPVTAAGLASWVVRSGHERILEPSFGGGALIEAALARSRSVTGRDSISVVGFDLDPKACVALSKTINGRSVSIQWKDFLEVAPADQEKFDAVLSNPPFTRNHVIPAERRAELRARFKVIGAAGLWVHFLLHSTGFLKPGGRMACVVPSSALFTDYGADLLRRLCRQFASVEILRLNEKPDWVGGAEEAGAFLLADGFGDGPCEDVLRGFWVEGRGAVSDYGNVSGAFVEASSAAQMLGDLAELRIGAVTGCNRAFLLSERERLLAGIAMADVRPIVSRARHIRGVLVTKKELKELGLAGEKTWLLSPRSLGQPGSSVRRRLASISPSERRKTVWLNKRKPWWAVDHGGPCDAVFSYMNHLGPRLAQVTPGLTCTNTLHRVNFLPGTSNRDHAAAIVTLASTFGQLAAERIGRVYGGGVLKFELREARRLPVIPLAADVALSILHEIDEALRKGDTEEATRIADRAVLHPICGPNWKCAAEELSYELNVRRMARGAGTHSHG